MSTVEATPEVLTVSEHTPTFVSLTRSEFLRIRSRRFVVVLVLLGFVGLLLAGFGVWQVSSKLTAADIAEGQAKRDVYVNMCGTGLTPAEKAEQCKPDDAPIEAFIDDRRAVPSDLRDTSVAVGGLLAVVAFAIGATMGGAEWAQKTMPALLFWEPRRLRVMAAKTLALAASIGLLAVVAQAVWTAWFSFVITTHGSWEDRVDWFWEETLANDGRLIILAVLAAVGGFALANLTRNTGAALGIGFVYLAIVDLGVRILAPVLSPALVSTGVVGTLTPGGFDVAVSKPSGPEMTEKMLHISNLGGSLILTATVAVFLTAATVLFVKRDVT